MNTLLNKNPVIKPEMDVPAPPSLKMILSLTSIAMISGFLIVLAYTLTLPRITENKRIALQNAILEIMPGSKEISKFLVMENGNIEEIKETTNKKVGSKDKKAGVRIYRGQKASGTLNGFVIEASGSGFQDVISIIYAYDPLNGKITGMKVMESKETPGLGDKIESDANFKRNFTALEVGLSDDGSATAHVIKAVKNGKKTEPWQVDGITGATISSKAISTIIQKSTTKILPIIQNNHKQLGFELGGKNTEAADVEKKEDSNSEGRSNE